jgi:hypothetical protein
LSHGILSLRAERSNLIHSIWLFLLASLLLNGCHGDPLTTPGYREPTEVGGVIESGTRWTADQGPFLITEDLVVPDSADFYVGGGTEIYVEWNKTIEVRGALAFDGQPSQRISVRAQQGIWRGFRFIGYGFIGDSSGGVIEGSSLSYVDIYDAVTAVECQDSSYLGLSECRIFSCDSIGVKVDSGCGAIIDNCQFDNDRTLNVLNPVAIWSNWALYLRVTDTDISGFQHAIRFYGASSCITIDGSSIADCDIGIVCDFQDSVLIQDNLFRGNDTAILISDGSPVLSGNDFTKNTECIHVEGNCAPTAHLNNFIDTGRWVWQHISRDTVDATMNWWGTTNPDSIAILIHDQEDDSTAGLVEFEPFLTSPRP